MLNIYYGRENIDKERFVYDQIRRRGYGPDQPVLVIVPDQYTLEAERQAFRWLETDSLLGLDVVSMSRLGHNILRELGGDRRTFIDKYGRQMLLTRIARDMKDELLVFRGNIEKESFITLANDFISQLKQYGVTPDILKKARDAMPGDSLLRRKLSDLSLTYTRYEMEIAGKYTDSEDYIQLYIDRIGSSRLVQGARIWIYGFDSFAPKSLQVLGGLMGAAEEVNAVLTWDGSRGAPSAAPGLFDLTGLQAENLRKQALEHGCPLGETAAIADLGSYPVYKKNKALTALESGLFASPIRPWVQESADQSTVSGPGAESRPDRASLPAGTPEKSAASDPAVTVCQAANIYNEAESAASYVLHLIRDLGYRNRDIVLICNDQKQRAPIIERVFQEYGLEIFSDTKRGIINSGVAVCLVSLLSAVQNRYRTTDIFRALKTGLTDMDMDDVEQLEVYAQKYRIRGSMWTRPFIKGAFEYGEEGLVRLEDLRARAMAIFAPLAELAAGASTVREFVAGYYNYLTDTVRLPDKLARFISVQREDGLDGLADETEQIWTMVMGILDQIMELIGEDPFDLGEFIAMFTVGLEQIEVGVLPSSIDDLMMGTMQRTRSAGMKVLVVLGANEGVLPAEAGKDALFAPQEMDRIEKSGFRLCKVDQVRMQEEKLAIYRNLSRPSEHLWISYSAEDPEGKSARPSDIVNLLLQLYPGLEAEPDIISRAAGAQGACDEPAMDMVGARLSTTRHMAEVMRGSASGLPHSPVWDAARDWLRDREPEQMEQVDRALAFENHVKRLSEGQVGALFKKGEEIPLVMSPSRLETYAHCPFRYYVEFGLKPREQRVFQVANRELGDVCHAVIMRVSQDLDRRGLWQTVSEEECREMTRQALKAETAGYRDGLFSYGNKERYQTARVEDTCFQSIWALVENARSSENAESHYEASFGRGRELPPVVMTVDGQQVVIEGKIDRYDVLQNGRTRVIDYKSSRHSLSEEDVAAGYRMQLMIYMKAAQQAGQPAGVFYFQIQDPRSDSYSEEAEAMTAAVAEEIQKQFKLAGLVVSDPETIREMDSEMDGFSQMIPVRKTSKGYSSSAKGRRLLSDEEFAELQNQLDLRIREFSQNLFQGRIDVQPMRSGDNVPCTYCEDRSICRFDLGFDGCDYRDVK